MNRIKWGEPCPPDGKISFYDHILGNWRNFSFIIEWKSWKECDSRVIQVFISLDNSVQSNSNLNYEFIGVSIKDDNESAKKFAEDWLEEFINNLTS